MDKFFNVVMLDDSLFAVVDYRNSIWFVTPDVLRAFELAKTFESIVCQLIPVMSKELKNGN